MSLSKSLAVASLLCLGVAQETCTPITANDPSRTGCSGATYAKGSTCSLSCAAGYLPSPDVAATQIVTCLGSNPEPATGPASWTTCEGVSLNEDGQNVFPSGCAQFLKCESTAMVFSAAVCEAPSATETRTSMVVEMPAGTGPYLVTDVTVKDPTQSDIIINSGTNPFPSGHIVFHEYTVSGAYSRSCLEMSMTGLSQSSSDCLVDETKCVSSTQYEDNNGGLAACVCTNADETGCTVGATSCGDYSNRLMCNNVDDANSGFIADNSTTRPAAADCTWKYNKYENPRALAGQAFTDYMTANNFKACDGNTAGGCSFHVHSYAVPSGSGVGRDQTCWGTAGGEGAVGYHFDPRQTGLNCAGEASPYSSCEMGDLSGKSTIGKLTGDLNGARIPSTGNIDLNIFTDVTGQQGSFGRSIVIHHPNGGVDGVDAWFCASIGKSCVVTAGAGSENDEMQRTCDPERTSSVYIWNGDGSQSVVRAGSECGGAGQSACVPGRTSPLNTIYKYVEPTEPEEQVASATATGEIIGVVAASAAVWMLV